MTAYFDGNKGWQPAVFLEPRIPSFTDFLAAYSPGLLPGERGLSLPDVAGGSDVIRDLPHATTLVAAACDHGVVVAGDRRATAGNMISKRDVEKVFRSDEFSAIGMAGVASIGLEFIRLFQVELEHYEKMEGRSLSLEGKANRLGAMVRGNLGAAMQGLAMIPLFAGYDEEKSVGRIFSYDVAGGPYEEHRFHSIGSGSVFAKSALKKLYSDGMSATDATLACVQALYDAADDDSATGGPDLTRRIFPVITIITDEGFRRLTDAESAEIAQHVVDERMRLPDGPLATLRNG
ncbi:MAG TPA: proteasome subunit beta [Trebonia sp.]|nr:proteasome subunit beta [Trebonia sp.]